MTRQTWSETRRLVRADIARRCSYENKPVTALRSFKLLFSPGVAVVALARWQRFFASQGWPLLGGMIGWLNLMLHTSLIDPDAQIEGGLVVIHATSVNIGAGVRIGPGCILFAQNYIGRSPFVEPGVMQDAAAPVIGAHVTFGFGACAHGGIVIGDRCRISVNALVENDAAPGSTLFGVPARVVAQSS